MSEKENVLKKGNKSACCDLESKDVIVKALFISEDRRSLSVNEMKGEKAEYDFNSDGVKIRIKKKQEYIDRYIPK